MVCREMLKEECLISICGMFDFIWFSKLNTCSPESEVNPVRVGRGEKFQARPKLS